MKARGRGCATRGYSFNNGEKPKSYATGGAVKKKKVLAKNKEDTDNKKKNVFARTAYNLKAKA